MKKRIALNSVIAVAAITACFLFSPSVRNAIAQQAATFWNLDVNQYVHIHESGSSGPTPLTCCTLATPTAFMVDASGNVTANSYTTATPSTNGYFFLPPNECGLTPTTTAFSAAPLLTNIAAGNQALLATTNGTGGTVEITCPVYVPSQLTTGYGVTLTSVSLYYGVQGANLTTFANPTFKSLTFPAAGGSAAGTVAAAGGSLTFSPSTIQKATTTAGLYYNLNTAFGTPIAVNTTNTSYAIDAVLTIPASDVTLAIAGMAVFYNKY